MPNKPRSSYKAGPADCCQTPAYALEPLLPYLPKESAIWEPACGERRIVDELKSHGYTVLGTDISGGTDFLEQWPLPQIQMIVTNPPWSHPAKGRFIARCYELGKPFALLVPVDTLGSKSFQDAARPHGFEVLLLDQRVDFYMPNKGYTKGGAHLPVLWLCHKLLPAPFVFGHVNKPEGM